VGPDLKTGGAWVLRTRQTVVHSTGLRVSSPECLFNYTQIFLFLKVTTFGKCSHLIFLYIIGYDNIWGMYDKNMGVVTAQPQDLRQWLQ